MGLYEFEKECEWCGEVFVKKSTRQKYCSRKCSCAAGKAQAKEHRRQRAIAERIKAQKKQNTESIAEVQRKAQAAGLSYGKYVLLMSGQNFG